MQDDESPEGNHVLDVLLHKVLQFLQLHCDNY